MKWVFKVLLGLGFLVLLSSHDLFLKTNNYFVPPDALVKLFLFNGTFDQSENSISRDRIIDATILGPDMQFHPGSGNWYDQDNITYLQFKTGESGTYVAGVSTAPKNIELSSEDFNAYLEHDGVLDELDARKEENRMSDDVIEKYSKHVKCILQVGEVSTDDFQQILGYPIEFILQDNPNEISAGDVVRFVLLRDSKPLPNQLVYYGHRTGDEEDTMEHVHDKTYTRTDEEGLGSINLSEVGVWYLRTIHMERSNEEELDYESNWATVSFMIR